jgi:hypothetical protein
VPHPQRARGGVVHWPPRLLARAVWYSGHIGYWPGRCGTVATQATGQGSVVQWPHRLLARAVWYSGHTGGGLIGKTRVPCCLPCRNVFLV